MLLKDSTKRAIRTLLQVLLAVLTVIPDIATHLPAVAVLGQVVVVAGAISKGVNLAEESGVMPAWLKDTTPSPAVQKDVDDAVKVIDEAAPIIEQKLGGVDPAP